MQKTALMNYAKLLARVGLNVQKGQEVIISAELDQPEFVELAAEECYRAGAAKVRVEWTHQPVARLSAQYCAEEVLGEVRPWQEEKLRCEVRELPARLYLESADPDGMNGIDAAKYARAAQARSRIVKPYRDKMENKYQWCIAAVAGEKWARKVFPRATGASIAEDKLWRAILSCSRALEGNPLENWRRHNADLTARCDHLNSLGLTSLEYQSSNGIDLRVGLLREGLFAAGEERTLSGIPFNPNIPSEEVFTSPARGEAEGIVYSTKPLSYQGRLIRNFSVRFEKGRAVEVHAATGEDVLKKMIEMDEGAPYLGECALVPFESPINQLGFLFYNTLYDENAACHLALGRGFSNLYPDFEKYTNEELIEKGINYSASHVDFMIGTRDLKIVGTKADGSEVTIFENGTWAI